MSGVEPSERAWIERLWAAHLARSFPQDLRGAEIGTVDLVLLDSDIAGYVLTWLRSERLDRNQVRILARCREEAARVARLLPRPTERSYYEALEELAGALLLVEGVLDEFSPRRTYLACRWNHPGHDDPSHIYMELDGTRFEVRKVHQFEDARLERTDRITDARTSLSWEPVPSPDEIAAQAEFQVEPLSATEFEAYWRRADPVGLPVLTIDGSSFDDFRGFVREFSKVLEDFEWNGSLDAFNDILRGGCGTPDGGFELRWLNSDVSCEALGWPATVAWLEDTLTRCHPTNVPHVRARLEAARRGEGTTLFDWIVEIAESHGPRGSESEDNVFLRLL